MSATLEADTYEMPKDGWVCFFCGERFTTVGSARDHFGAALGSEPGCLIRVQAGGELGLLVELRKREVEVLELREQLALLSTIQQEYAFIHAELARRFNGAKSVNEAYLMLDAMEGRALAAEKQQVLLRSIAQRISELNALLEAHYAG